jgi:DeoR family transcriptional regulator, suf operon transcriptional repressor
MVNAGLIVQIYICKNQIKDIIISATLQAWPSFDSAPKGICPSMATSRQKILLYLKKNRSASAREIARALKISAPNVRHHLSVLGTDGRVEFVAVNNREGRGRPEKLYSLPQAALGDNLSALVNALLDEAGPKVRTDALARRILDTGQFLGLPIQKRLALLIEKLNEMNYQARWEAAAEGPRVILGHCPYAKVIEGHAELCTMDARILENALAQPVKQLAKGESAMRGSCPFIFQVG